jgi:hypothetical protein
MAAADALASAVLRLCVVEDGSTAWTNALTAVQAALAGYDHVGGDQFTAALAAATRDLCACAWNSDAWGDARAALADVLGEGGHPGPPVTPDLSRVRPASCVGPSHGLRSLVTLPVPDPAARSSPSTAGNTYLTWSLALPAHRHEALLLAPGEGGSGRAVSPASVGITDCMPPPALKVGNKKIRPAFSAPLPVGIAHLTGRSHTPCCKKQVRLARRTPPAEGARIRVGHRPGEVGLNPQTDPEEIIF